MNTQKLFLITALIAALVGLAGCGSSGASTATVKKTTATATATPKATPTPTPLTEDPNVPFFMRTLDPKKNSDGTYSFKGIITNYKALGGDVTLYITALNGRKFSTGDGRLLASMYVNGAGKYSTIVSDVVSAPYLLEDIVFEFVYDSEGNFIKLKQ